MNDGAWVGACLAVGALSLAAGLSRLVWIGRQNPGGEAIREIGREIRQGAGAFMHRQYRVMGPAVALPAVVLALSHRGDGRFIAAAFVLGAFLSGLAGFIGMRAATKANTRTAFAARESTARAFGVAFNGGSVMGLVVVGLALAGLSVLTLAIRSALGGPERLTIPVEILTGYSLGASSVALFARVGGGIFTKAADVGADLVGKLEAGIPEDDPRNPATIADNVGDNVGDVAGLGSDLCESYIASIVGAMVLGARLLRDPRFVILPLPIAAAGILASLAGTRAVTACKNHDPRAAINVGTVVAVLLMPALSLPVLWLYPPPRLPVPGGTVGSVPGLLAAIVSGLVAGVAIGLLAQHYTRHDGSPVAEIARQSTTGAATNIIAGLRVGMASTGLPVVALAAAILTAYRAAGLYGIALAAIGMLGTTGMQISVDAYGPIADNAGGIAEMARMGPDVRHRTDALDSVGNTTAAVCKGFAIGSAALTALVLFVAYKEAAGVATIDIAEPKVVCGALCGAMLPFVLCARIMGAVGRAAFTMIEEVRRQFREIEGLLAGNAKPDCVACVDIAAAAAIREMAVPCLTAVGVPVAVGFVGGKEMLAGLLLGTTVSGVLLALFMANAGGAWDNAKKRIEAGEFGGKGSPAHRAAVVGDTVGDPFKDAAGPALNILIKLMGVVSLILAPIL